MKSEYCISIMRHTHPKYVVLNHDYDHIFSTDSKYELKIWLDLNGLKFERWSQKDYNHFNTGIEGVKYMIIVDFCDKED